MYLLLTGTAVISVGRKMETSPLLPFLIPVDYKQTVNSSTVNIGTDLFNTVVAAIGKLHQKYVNTS